MTDKQLEVEAKFVISEIFLNFLKEKAEFIGTVQLLDEYFDTPNFDLILSNRWLRRRNGEWELKLPPEDFDPTVTVFNEVTDLALICEALDINSSAKLEEDLKLKDIRPMIVVNSKRDKYQYNDFKIDLDSTDFGYTLMEIEMIVSQGSEVADAKRKINEFALSVNPDIQSHSIGKVRYYAIKFFPQVEAEIVKRGIYKPLSDMEYSLIRNGK